MYVNIVIHICVSCTSSSVLQKLFMDIYLDLRIILYIRNYLHFLVYGIAIESILFNVAVEFSIFARLNMQMQISVLF